MLARSSASLFWLLIVTSLSSARIEIHQPDIVFPIMGFRDAVYG
jgi:hypothetical protein